MSLLSIFAPKIAPRCPQKYPSQPPKTLLGRIVWEKDIDFAEKACRLGVQPHQYFHELTPLLVQRPLKLAPTRIGVEVIGVGVMDTKMRSLFI